MPTQPGRLFFLKELAGPLVAGSAIETPASIVPARTTFWPALRRLLKPNVPRQPGSRPENTTQALAAAEALP